MSDVIRYTTVEEVIAVCRQDYWFFWATYDSCIHNHQSRVCGRTTPEVFRQLLAMGHLQLDPETIYCYDWVVDPPVPTGAALPGRVRCLL